MITDERLYAIRETNQARKNIERIDESKGDWVYDKETRKIMCGEETIAEIKHPDFRKAWKLAIHICFLHNYPASESISDLITEVERLRFLLGEKIGETGYTLEIAGIGSYPIQKDVYEMIEKLMEAKKTK